MDDIKRITINDQNYPELLRKIKNPPKNLYFRGDIRPEEICLAIVGTRLCSAYGKQITIDIAGSLAETELTIVSGLAPGIDTLSHKSAVEKGKRTIAVLGTGLDEKSFYPKENIALAKKIIENNGCLISEYAPGTRASAFTFPQRNRIISGLSLGVLVVEAKEKSGSLITANYAFRQKRKVFAVPGPIYSQNSKGTNLLIKKGAKLVDKAADILQELGFEALRGESQTPAGKTPGENLILKSLEEEPLHIDKIIEKTKLKAEIVAGTLAILEMEGKARNLGGNVYALAR